MSNKNYISNSHESIPMFRNGLLEKLSKVHFSIPLFLYIPVIAWCCWMALFQVQSGIITWALTVLAGIFVWSFVEYVMHRFVFHFEPSSKWGRRLHFIFHGVHHDYPNDAMRLVLPPSVSIPLATGFYLLYKSFIPDLYFYGFFAGFIGGYLFYDISHYALHHFNFKGRFWKKLKKHHMMHHYADATRGYGVSSSFWDKIFRSDFQK
ncbi:sterol desaturase family protein [Chitinophaga rhizophila]|uniref:Sterol desaturase family protein n=1 Tax=Chitinophaga rhizophila TaxID=2866212 RepID=A0ABS7G7I4_9BACT|nr:sterol desaturase family protein [Chitinophaga rhizophila]MBW8683622.1 sterol desaturase family protein [Chitinophaga rhizophila]